MHIYKAHHVLHIFKICNPSYLISKDYIGNLIFKILYHSVTFFYEQFGHKHVTFLQLIFIVMFYNNTYVLRATDKLTKTLCYFYIFYLNFVLSFFDIYILPCTHLNKKLLN